MANTPKILAFAGSTRADSYNKKLVRIAAAGAQKVGAEATLIDLRDYPLPVYDGDLERHEGIPENGMELKQIFLTHHGLLLACPEYNSSITAVLKNTIDWVSRPAPAEPSLGCFKGKVVTLMSASPGNLGGLRGLIHVRAILGNLGCIVLPEQLAINKARNAFNAEGQLSDTAQQNGIEGLGVRTAEILHRLLV